MEINLDLHLRLEPRASHRTDLDRGFKAEIADPAWFVGRQWQMGEHQGENAASPVLTRITYARRPLLPAPGRPGQFPGHRRDGDPQESMPISPAETILEGEPDDWWTLGRRVRVGRAAQEAVDSAQPPVDAALLASWRLPALPEPYDEFSGGYDGRELHKAVQDGLLALDANLFAGAPTARRDSHWLPADLKYGRVTFPVDTGEPGGAADTPSLLVRDHLGGEVEWWTADAAGDWSAQVPEELLVKELDVQPSRFSYPGAPHPRWWQIEDARVDIGGLPPDRSHFASLLLLDLLLAHSDDWFILPLVAQIGDVLTITDLVVVDLFKEEFSWSAHPQLQPPADWSLFKVHDLDDSSIVLWPTVAVPVAGEPLEEIALGVDEDANLMWAVEERAEGLRLTSIDLDPPPGPTIEPNPALNVTSSTNYLYLPSTYVPHHWHPYVIQAVDGRRTFVQGRLVDYTGIDAGQASHMAPKPVAELLQDPARTAQDPMHQINPAVVPSTGLRLERRYLLARRTDGAPVLWVQRQCLPLFSPPASNLRFDVLEESNF